MDNKPIRLLIAHPDINFSRKLQVFLDQQEDMQTVDIVRDGPGAVESCRQTLPDLVLLDLRLPVLDSIHTIQAILAQNERIKILSISAISNDRYAIEAIKAGARGYIERNGREDFEAIAGAIRQIANGEVVLNPNLASTILQEFYRLAE
jgi:DNA-binding NarL/FixJ family response regulator